jgi:pyroglutamyl-peptidase
MDRHGQGGKEGARAIIAAKIGGISSVTMRILLTGFEPFGEVAVNPSQVIVEAVAARHVPGVITAVLPVTFGEAADCIRSLIAAHAPDAVICLGIASSRKAINLERVALNVNDAPQPDNAGVLASGDPIEADGPVGYWSTLPLKTMLEALAARGIPAVISNHAGTYVCNHVFYAARHMLEQSGRAVPCGFIHVPPIAADDDTPGLPLQMMIEAVSACLDVVAKATNS